MVRRRSWSGALPFFDLPALMIGDLPELTECSFENGVFRAGAAMKLADIAENRNTPEILRLAINRMASPAIRNTGTVGGNICNASPAGDTLPPLYALDATVTVHSLTGSREIPVRQFIKGPGRTDLADDELLTSINIPAACFQKNYYRKVGTRKADALSKLSFAGLANVRENRIETLRVAIGAVAPTVVRSIDAESLLTGMDRKDVPKLAPVLKKIYSSQIRPINDQRSNAGYRKLVSLRLLEDFLSGI